MRRIVPWVLAAASVATLVVGLNELRTRRAAQRAAPTLSPSPLPTPPATPTPTPAFRTPAATLPLPPSPGRAAPSTPAAPFAPLPAVPPTPAPTPQAAAPGVVAAPPAGPTARTGGGALQGGLGAMALAAALRAAAVGAYWRRRRW